MTKRARMPVFAAALAACLLPACARQYLQPLPPPLPPAPTAQPLQPPTPPAPAAAPSPYHPVRTDETTSHGALALPRSPSEDAAAGEPDRKPGRAPVRLLSAEEVQAAQPVPRTRAVPPLPQTTAPPDEPLVLALRSFLEHRPAEAVRQLQQYDRESQELLLRLLPLAAGLTRKRLATCNPEELATFLDQLEEVAEPLRPQATLIIDKMCFCREIELFGVYEPWPEDRAFQAGRDRQQGELVKVYAELRNFSSEPDGPFHVTRLAGSVRILNADGRVAWCGNALPQPDRSRSSRHDYFINCRFCVPPQCPPGTYTLVIEVTDVPTGRRACRSLAFRVVPPSLSP